MKPTNMAANSSQSVQLELSNSISAVLMSSLFVAGVLGNLIALLVIDCSGSFSIKRSQRPTRSDSRVSRGSERSQASSRFVRMPSISNKKYLVIFFLTNLAYLVIHFYTDTIKRLLYVFQVRVEIDLEVDQYNRTTVSYLRNPFYVRMATIDSTSEATCKISYYLQNVSRLLNLMSIATFSFKQLITLYLPSSSSLLRLRLGMLSRVFLLVMFLISFSASIGSINSYELVNLDVFHLTIGTGKGHIHPKFIAGSNKPTITNSICRMVIDNDQQQQNYNLTLWSILALLYILISFSAIVLCVRLKNVKLYRPTFEYKVRFSSNSDSKVQIETPPHSPTLSTSVFPQGGSFKATTTFVPTFRKPSRVERRFKSSFLNSRLQSIMGVSFMVINFPSFLSFLYFIYMAKFRGNSFSEPQPGLTKSNMVVYLHILGSLNYSLVTLVLLVATKLFRIYLKRIPLFFFTPTMSECCSSSTC